VKFAPNLPEWFPVSEGDMKAIISDGWHFIRNGDGREELYDLERDWKEENSLAGSKEDLLIQTLRKRLDSL
jgi:hypothetical protein